MILRLIFALVLLMQLISIPPASFAYSPDTAPYSIKSPEELAYWLRNEFAYEMKFPDHLQTPEETMALHRGDCDDFAVLSRAILRGIGIRSDAIIIKFRQIGIMHAICIFKKGRTYSFISSRELVRTRGHSITEAVTETFPDWEQIIYVKEGGEYGEVVDRRGSIDLAANNLAVPSFYGDLLSAEQKDVNLIKLVLNEELARLDRTHMPVNVGTFMTILKDRAFGYSSRHSVSFLFKRVELTPTGFLVPCRAQDTGGERYYHAIFSMNRSRDGGFSVAVYPDEEWSRIGGADNAVPHEGVNKAPAVIEAPAGKAPEQACPAADLHTM